MKEEKKGRLFEIEAENNQLKDKISNLEYLLSVFSDRVHTYEGANKDLRLLSDKQEERIIYLENLIGIRSTPVIKLKPISSNNRNVHKKDLLDGI